MEDTDVGEILTIKLMQSWFGRQDDWFVNKVYVTKTESSEVYEFPCYRWVQSELVVFEGKGNARDPSVFLFSLFLLIAHTVSSLDVLLCLKDGFCHSRPKTILNPRLPPPRATHPTHPTPIPDSTAATLLLFMCYL